MSHRVPAGQPGRSRHPATTSSGEMAVMPKGLKSSTLNSAAACWRDAGTAPRSKTLVSIEVAGRHSSEILSAQRFVRQVQALAGRAPLPNGGTPRPAAVCSPTARTAVPCPRAAAPERCRRFSNSKLAWSIAADQFGGTFSHPARSFPALPYGICHGYRPRPSILQEYPLALHGSTLYVSRR